jgi:hypothetical protein
MDILVVLVYIAAAMVHVIIAIKLAQVVMEPEGVKPHLLPAVFYFTSTSLICIFRIIQAIISLSGPISDWITVIVIGIWALASIFFYMDLVKNGK